MKKFIMLGRGVSLARKEIQGYYTYPNDMYLYIITKRTGIIPIQCNNTENLKLNILNLNMDLGLSYPHITEVADKKKKKKKGK